MIKAVFIVKTQGRGLAFFKPRPEYDRPREKLFKKSAHVLSNSELLEIPLRIGAKGVIAIDLAR